MADTEAHWYVAHTYSGYENKVKMDIEQTIANRGLQDQILEVSVPMLTMADDEDEAGDGDKKKKVVQRKMFPAYVLIKMIMNDDTWYVVRNTRGVTGFVGPGSKPVPLTDAEIASMGIKTAESAPFAIGDAVVVKSGSLEDRTGIVKKIDHENRMVTITIDVFGRETPTELSFNDVEKV